MLENVLLNKSCCGDGKVRTLNTICCLPYWISIISASRKLGKSSLRALLQRGQKRKQLTSTFFGKENENRKNQLQVKVCTRLEKMSKKININSPAN